MGSLACRRVYFVQRIASEILQGGVRMTSISRASAASSHGTRARAAAGLSHSHATPAAAASAASASSSPTRAAATATRRLPAAGRSWCHGGSRAVARHCPDC
jgi:hypothetical protein